MDINMQWLWIHALVVFTIVEASTTALMALWFIGGSLVAYVLSLLSAPVWIQVSVFLIVSLTLLLILRPLLQKNIQERKIPTNLETLIGRIVPVVEEIDNLHAKGAVRVAGVEWTAFSKDGSVIAKDVPVKILSVNGAKLCVEPAEIV